MTTKEPKKRPLKMELEPDDENMLTQLVAALQRIEGGLQDIVESIEELSAKVDDVRTASDAERGE